LLFPKGCLIVESSFFGSGKKPDALSTQSKGATMEKSTRKAERRHHKARVRRRRIDVVAHWKAHNPRARGVAVETPTAVAGYKEKIPALQDLRHKDWRKDAILAWDLSFVQGNRTVVFH
jgi:hypothetical protein